MRVAGVLRCGLNGLPTSVLLQGRRWRFGAIGFYALPCGGALPRLGRNLSLLQDGALTGLPALGGLPWGVVNLLWGALGLLGRTVELPGRVVCVKYALARFPFV